MGNEASRPIAIHKYPIIREDAYILQPILASMVFVYTIDWMGQITKLLVSRRTSGECCHSSIAQSAEM